MRTEHIAAALMHGGLDERDEPALLDPAGVRDLRERLADVGMLLRRDGSYWCAAPTADLAVADEHEGPLHGRLDAAHTLVLCAYAWLRSTGATVTRPQLIAFCAPRFYTQFWVSGIGIGQLIRQGYLIDSNDELSPGPRYAVLDVDTLLRQLPSLPPPMTASDNANCD